MLIVMNLGFLILEFKAELNIKIQSYHYHQLKLSTKIVLVNLKTLQKYFSQKF